VETEQPPTIEQLGQCRCTGTLPVVRGKDRRRAGSSGVASYDYLCSKDNGRVLLPESISPAPVR